MKLTLLLIFLFFIPFNAEIFSQNYWYSDLIVNFNNEQYIFRNLYLLKKNNNSYDTLAVIPKTTLSKLLEYRKEVKEHFYFDSTKYDISDLIILDCEFVNAAFTFKKKIWFGIAFYEGEGCEGIGGIGFYDSETGNVGLLNHPAIRDYSVKELAVTDDTIYVKTFGFYELTETYGTGIVAISIKTLSANAKVPPGSKMLFNYSDPEAVNTIYKLSLAELINKKSQKTFESQKVEQYADNEKEYIIKKGLFDFMIEEAAKNF